MKILHVAVFISGSTNVWQANGFEVLGHKVIRYDYRDRARKLDGSLKLINPKRDNDLIDLCYKEDPDIILFSKCNWMDIRVIEECSKVGKTVLWYMDNACHIDNELVLKIKKCNYVFCSTRESVIIAKKYNNNVYRLQGGYNPDVHYPMKIPKLRNIVFMGNVGAYYIPYRSEYCGINNCDIINNVFNKDHSRIVSETKINLSLTTGDGVSNRLYKLLASKGFVLTMPWDTMKEDFTPGKDFVVFNSPEELKSKIKYYLTHTKEREKIAQHGYETVKKYDNVNYAKRILEKIVL